MILNNSLTDCQFCDCLYFGTVRTVRTRSGEIMRMAPVLVQSRVCTECIMYNVFLQ